MTMGFLVASPPPASAKTCSFFGARVNLAKALLLAINGGRDEKTGEQVLEVPTLSGEYLDWREVWENYEQVLTWLSVLYSRTMNCIHYMRQV